MYMSFETAFYSLLAFLFLCYLGVQLLVLKGLSALKKRQEKVSDEKPKISVIVAARNEEANIGRCLHALVHQDYPASSFEIIVVDDRSTDRTASIVHNYCVHNSSVKLISLTQLSSDLPPKKNALNEAIERSRFDIVAFTDADWPSANRCCDLWMT